MRREELQAKVQRLVDIHGAIQDAGRDMMDHRRGGANEATHKKAKDDMDRLNKEAMAIFVEVGCDVLGTMERIAVALEKLSAPRGP